MVASLGKIFGRSSFLLTQVNELPNVLLILNSNTYRFLMLAQVINVMTVAISASHKPTTTVP